MSDWLVKLAAQEATDTDRLFEALSELPLADLRELMLETGMIRQPTTHLEAFQEKLAFAESTGRELAHRSPGLVKQAGKLWGGTDRDLTKHFTPEQVAHIRAQEGGPDGENPYGPDPKKLVEHSPGVISGTLGGATLAAPFGAIPGAVIGGLHGGLTGGPKGILPGAGKGALTGMGIMGLGGAAGGFASSLDQFRKPEKHAKNIKDFYGDPPKKEKTKTAGLGGTIASMGRKAIGAAKPQLGRALSLAEKSPTAALAAAGGAAGAVHGLASPGTDPYTGQQKSRLGAMLTHGAMGAGAGALASKLPTGGGFNVGDRVSGLAALGQQGLRKMASASEFIKLSMALACGPDGSSDWLEQFKGTPLLQQAVELEKQSLALEGQEIQLRQEEQAERAQNQQKWQMRDQLWAQRDQLSLQKRQLALQLAEHEVGAMGGAPAQPEAPAPAAPPQPEPQQAAPAPEQGMPKVAGMQGMLGTAMNAMKANPGMAATAGGALLGAGAGALTGGDRMGPNGQVQHRSRLGRALVGAGLGAGAGAGIHAGVNALQARQAVGGPPIFNAAAFAPPAEDSLQALVAREMGRMKVAHGAMPVVSRLGMRPPPIPAAAQSLGSKLHAVGTSELARLGPGKGPLSVNGALTSSLAKSRPDLYSALARLG